MLLWLVPLPLAIPTYLAAYVYVDLFEPLGLVHRTLAIWFPLQDAVRVLPNLRSLPGAIIVIALVLYPYVYLSARTMFQFQSAEYAEAAKTLGAGALDHVLAHLAADGAAGARGRDRAGVAGNAERHRRQRISRRPHADGVGVHDLAQSRQPCRRGAAFLLHAGDRRRPDRDRALRPPQRHDGIFRRKPAADAADPAHRRQGRLRICRLPAAGLARISGAAAVSRASEFQARAVGEFRHGAVARRLQLGRVREHRHAGGAAARLRDHSGLALAADRRCASSR